MEKELKRKGRFENGPWYADRLFAGAIRKVKGFKVDDGFQPEHFVKIFRLTCFDEYGPGRKAMRSVASSLQRKGGGW